MDIVENCSDKVEDIQWYTTGDVSDILYIYMTPSQNTTQKSISIAFWVSSIRRHSASTVNRSSHPPGHAPFLVFPGGGAASVYGTC